LEEKFVMSSWLYIGIFVVISLFLPTAAITIAGILSPHKSNPQKTSTYECGIETVGRTWIQFKVAYYLYGLVFLVFDVEVLFLYPWAVAYQQLDLFGVLEGGVFVLILLGGLVYVWKKGALEWQ
jgi:NADH:ubiquinone oxidoreductase subunit 3 (subunit A)